MHWRAVWRCNAVHSIIEMLMSGMEKMELYTPGSIGRVYMLMGKKDRRIRKCQKYL